METEALEVGFLLAGDRVVAGGHEFVLETDGGAAPLGAEGYLARRWQRDPAPTTADTTASPPLRMVCCDSAGDGPGPVALSAATAAFNGIARRRALMIVEMAETAAGADSRELLQRELARALPGGSLERVLRHHLADREAAADREGPQARERRDLQRLLVGMLPAPNGVVLVILPPTPPGTRPRVGVSLDATQERHRTYLTRLAERLGDRGTVVDLSAGTSEAVLG